MRTFASEPWWGRMLTQTGPQESPIFTGQPRVVVVLGGVVNHAAEPGLLSEPSPIQG